MINYAEFLPVMLDATWVTLTIFFLTALLSLPLGIIVSIVRKSKYKIFSVPIRIYQLIMRGTPLILQLMFVAYAPFYIFGISIDRFPSVIIAFVINYAAYFSEIFRAGIESIPQGQYEAAKVLGYTKTQTFLKIILPQVIKRILPTMGSEFMTLIKDTALAYTIGVSEIYKVAQTSSSHYFVVTPLIIAGVFYLVMNAIVEISFKKIENKLNYYN